MLRHAPKVCLVCCISLCYQGVITDPACPKEYVHQTSSRVEISMFTTIFKGQLCLVPEADNELHCVSGSLRSHSVCLRRQGAEGQTAEAEARGFSQEWRREGCRPGSGDFLTGNVID